MLRTIAVRSDLIKGTFRKTAINYVITRALAVECSKRVPLNRHTQTSIKPRIPHQCSFQIIRHYASYPKHTKVTLPALSPTMEEGKIISWAKKEGDQLNEGDLLAEIETDKATMAFETPEEGFLAKILIPAGTKGIKVGKLVCIIVETQGDVAAFKDFKDDGTAAAPPKPAAKPAPAPVAAAPPPAAAGAPAAPPPAPSGRVYVSPMAKRLAEERQIRLQAAAGGAPAARPARATSPGPAAKGAPAPPKGPAFPRGAVYVDVPVTNIRAVIAKRLLESKQTIPHYYLTVEVCVDTLMKIRNDINKKLAKEKVKISVNDFIVKACAMASKKVPEANSQWNGSFIRQFKNVDVSIAVSTPTGLITPIVFEADNKGIIDINKEIKELAGRARINKLQPQEYQGGTITVSNLGMFGVTKFDAVINPPQSCILAVGTTVKRLVEDPNTEKGFKKSQFMYGTLSADHRVLDGALGANWLKAFTDNIENPVNMIF